MYGEVDVAHEMSEHVVRARKTAAIARGVMAVAGLSLLAGWPGLSADRLLAAGGFAVILVTSVVQLAVPRLRWLTLEESLAGTAGIAIVGLGDQRVTILSVLWLAAVASGVLARGGRVHWIGRAVLLTALVLPIARMGRIEPAHAGLIVAAIALLLTCGRVTVELNQLLALARHDADHDSLTGALGRAALQRELGARMEDAAETGLVVIDLDDFGRVNKASGHSAGDLVLVGAVERMRAAAGAGAIVGRLGGDEFAVVVPGADPGAVAGSVVDALGSSSDGATALRASAGIASAPHDGADAEALLRAADVALRVAKRGGKHQIAVYEGHSLTETGPTGARGALERLIAGEGIQMAVQAIVDAQTGRAHAYEALARFRTRGVDSPLHWFALADEFGVRIELELACLSAALDLLPERPAGTRLSVNLSGPTLLDPRGLPAIEARAGLEGLIVEVTEDALVRDDEAMRAALARLQARGVRIAVDDMGAGYSGLGQITSLRPAYLKLDRSLVRGIDRDSDRGALVEALVHYARRTGGHVVAEGVEEADELAAVRALGVDFVQGYYYGRPGPGWTLQPVALPIPNPPLPGR